MPAVAATSGECLVAVYGTLRRGNANAHLLAAASLLGTYVSRAIVLYDLGEYPGARSLASDGIELEVYLIDDATLQVLDQLEEFDPANPASSLYVRQELQTIYGNAWVYLYQGTVAGRRPIKAGRWIARRAGPGGVRPGNSRKETGSDLLQSAH
jgi:gamma-glutamylcyclotransferase (GGCT)/AIG2-like uncharacterized protein YtfP